MEYKYTQKGDELTQEAAQTEANKLGESIRLYRTPGDNGADYVTVNPQPKEEQL